MNKNMVFTLCNSLLVEPDSLWVTCPLPRQPSASPTTPARATSSSKSASRCMHNWKCNFLPINPHVRVLVGLVPHKTEFGWVHMRCIYASFLASYNPHFGNEMSTFTIYKKWSTIYTHASASSSHMRPCFSRICGRILISYKVTLPCSNRSTCCKLVFFNQ